MHESLGSNGALARYIAQVRAVPPLDREQEQRLARAFKAGGDRRAAELLARASARHVVSIALGYRRYGLPLAELVAEGNFGLVQALERFDPDRGARFVTYAAYWIRAAILNHVIRSWSLVGAGSGALRSKLFFRLRRERARIAGVVGADAEAAETLLGQCFQAPADKVVALARRLEAKDVSLDEPRREDGGGALVDSLAAPEEDLDARIDQGRRGPRLVSAVQDACSQLDARELYIVRTRMMADPEEELSLAEIGRNLGVSRERVRQLEARAKRKLRLSLAPLAA